jgi:hypothetical protein
MASTNYRYPPAPPNGTGTFSDNLVGNQFTNGSSQMSNGNFSTTNSSKSQSVSFTLGGFSEPVTLDSMDIGSIDVAKAQSSNNLDVFINYDTSDLSNMVLYGSLKKRLSVAVDNVINSFPAALYVDGFNVNNVSGNTTAYNISYDTTTKRTTLRVPVDHLDNPFSIEFTTNGELVVDGISPEQVINNMSMFGNEASTSVKIAEGKMPKIRNLTKEYEKYVLTFNNAITTTEYKVVNFTPESVSTNFIELIVEGQPFGTTTVTTTTQFYIKPNLVESETQLRSLNGVESFLMTRDISPIYTAKFKLVKETDSGKKYYSHKSLTWPMVDEVNLDIVGIPYTTYIGKLSEIGDELDGIKTNLVSRFLTAPTLKEFDTSDQKVEKTLQIYGRSFDDIKTFVDGIAYMTNVTYDGKKNIPNELTKNFARTLGWSTPSTLNKTGFLDSVLGVTTPQYSGSSVGMTPAELDVELYKRILMNTGYLFKSKGTRKAIEFLLTLLGAPEALIEFNEYVVVADKKVDLTPKAKFVWDVDPVSGTQPNSHYEFSTSNFISRWGEISGGTYNTKSFELSLPLTLATGINQFYYETGTTYHNFTLLDYPVDQSGYPKRPLITDNYFFQRGAGWFERTEEHKSELITDFDNSVLSGCTPHVVNRFREFTWGGFWTMGQYSNLAEAPYLDRFRRFPHMSIGYGLTRVIDDKKSWVRVDDERMSVGAFDRKGLEPYNYSEKLGNPVVNNNNFYMATDSTSCDELTHMVKGLENILLNTPLSSTNTRSVYKSRLNYINELIKHRCFDSDTIREFEFKTRNANYHVDDERLVLNVKNVDLSLNIGQALVYDVWKQSKDSNCFFSGGTLPSPYSNGLGKWDATNPKINAKKINFKEFNENFWRYFIDVKTRMTISDGKTGGYPALQQIYLDYLKNNCGDNNQYTYSKMAKYAKSLGDHWIRIIEQMVPTTTLWTGGIKIENSAFHRDKFVYRCFDIDGEPLSSVLTGNLTVLTTPYNGFPASQMGTGPNTMVAPPVVNVGSAMANNMINGDTPNQTSTYANLYNINNPTSSGGNILTYGQTTALAGQFQTNGTSYNSTTLFTNRGATDNLLYVFGLNEGGDNNWVLDYDL